MNERPIIFSGPMVRAILDGRKTQTRRVCKPQREGCPYGQPGDRLWVREAWRLWHPASDRVLYRADKARSLGMDEYSDRHRWKPSIHMPRRFSRITLEVTNVRVERVQDISEDDAEAEGLRGTASGPWGREGLIEDFSDLWDSINAKRGYGWDTNPRVWVVEFRRIDNE